MQNPKSKILEYRSIRFVLVVLISLTTLANVVLAQFFHPQMSQDHTQMVADLKTLATQPINDTTIAQTFEVIKPRGVPTIYGNALGVSFDNVQESIDVMVKYDPYKQIDVIKPEIMERYKKIGLLISCEYCCSAKTLIFDNGVAACGCDHSRAMRGLTRYLLEAYPKMTDNEILAELVKWKAVYFPSDASKKALELVKNGNFNPDTYLINNEVI